jgi:hypothetical protein
MITLCLVTVEVLPFHAPLTKHGRQIRRQPRS